MFEWRLWAPRSATISPRLVDTIATLASREPHPRALSVVAIPWDMSILTGVRRVAIRIDYGMRSNAYDPAQRSCFDRGADVNAASASSSRARTLVVCSNDALVV